MLGIIRSKFGTNSGQQLAPGVSYRTSNVFWPRPARNQGRDPKWFLASSNREELQTAGLRPISPQPARPKALSAMEYIIVEIKDKPNVDTDVLINRQPNGRTGVLLMLGGPGWIFVSADWPRAIEQRVNVKSTTPQHPMNITIECE